MNSEKKIMIMFPKKMLRKKNLLIILTFIMTFASFCESKDTSSLKQARKHFEQEEYEEAIAFYEEAIKNKEDYSKAKDEIAKTLYHLGKIYYEKKDYDKTILYLTKLTQAYPNSPYKKQALITIKNAYYQNINKLFTKKAFHKCLNEIENYSLTYSKDDKIKEIETKSLYNIALMHYSSKEYFLAKEYIKATIPISKPLITKTKKLEEKILFFDGKAQLQIKAYENAEKAFKELLIKYPNSKYKKNTLKYINYIRKAKTSSNTAKQEALALDNSSYNKEQIEEKGNDENTSYTKKDIMSIIEYIKEEKEKNVENLKKNILPLYKDKYVKLSNMEIANYKKANKEGLLNEKTRTQIDSILNWSKKNIAYKYVINIKTIKSLSLMLKEKDFLKLNFKTPIKPIDFLGKVFQIKITKEKIRIIIIPLKITQQ